MLLKAIHKVLCEMIMIFSRYQLTVRVMSEVCAYKYSGCLKSLSFLRPHSAPASPAWQPETRGLTFLEFHIPAKLSWVIFALPHPLPSSRHPQTEFNEISEDVMRLLVANNSEVCECDAESSQDPGVIYFPTLQPWPGPGLLCPQWVRVFDPFTKPVTIYRNYLIFISFKQTINILKLYLIPPPPILCVVMICWYSPLVRADTRAVQAGQAGAGVREARQAASSPDPD